MGAVTRADRWLQDVRGARGSGAPPLDDDVALAVLADLEARHGEPARRYHTIEHVDAVLDALDDLVATAPDGELGTPAIASLALAAWFHDAVYDPTGHDNEAASAELAADELTDLGASPEVIAEVARLVQLTAGHTVRPDDRVGALLADADLSILGASPDAYDRYAGQIRVEYGHVPDDAYRIGRADILAGFLGRPQIYRTRAGRDRWERRARENLERERAALLG